MLAIVSFPTREIISGEPQMKHYPARFGRREFLKSAGLTLPLLASAPRGKSSARVQNPGVTHLTNGCYRLHPVEWNTGEAAGALAAFCLACKKMPR